MSSSGAQRPSALSPEQIERALTQLPGWITRGAAIAVEYRFDGFAAAFGFMAAAATEAAALDHHPDWSNSYSTVSVSLSTHDVGAVTELDIALAMAMTRLAAAADAVVDGEDTWA